MAEVEINIQPIVNQINIDIYENGYGKLDLIEFTGDGTNSYQDNALIGVIVIWCTVDGVRVKSNEYTHYPETGIVEFTYYINVDTSIAFLYR